MDFMQARLPINCYPIPLAQAPIRRIDGTTVKLGPDLHFKVR